MGVTITFATLIFGLNQRKNERKKGQSIIIVHGWALVLSTLGIIESESWTNEKIKNKNNSEKADQDETHTHKK